MSNTTTGSTSIEKDIKISFALVFLYFVFQLILFPKNYLNVDSFYYLRFQQFPEFSMEIGTFLNNIMSLGFGTFFLALCSLATVGLFYLLLRRFFSQKISFFVTLLFALDPLSFFNLQFSIIDKNPIIMLLWISFFYLWTWDTKKVMLKGSILILYLLLIAWVWTGFVIILFLMLSIYIIYGFLIQKNITLTIHVLIWIVVCIVGISTKTFSILINTKELVAELRYAWQLFSGIYFFYIIVIIVATILLFKTKNKSFKFWYATMILTLLLFLFMFRFNIFFIPVIYIMVGFILSYQKNKKTMITISYFFILFCILSFPMYIREPVVNDNIIESVEWLNNNSNKNCIHGDFGKGHIYQYYTNKTVIARGHINIDHVMNTFVYGNNTKNCSFIIEIPKDIKTWKRIAEMNNYTDKMWIEEYSEIARIDYAENESFMLVII